MDPQSFDSLTRSLAAAKTRRGFLGSLAALGAGLFGARATDAQVTQAQCGNKTCANNPGRCADGCVCCLYPNGNSRCRPPGTCSPGRESCPAARPFFDTALGCVQCVDPSPCPAPTGLCTSAACVNGVCTATASEDGADCAGGVCVGGVCCDSGADLPSGGEFCDALNGGTCCSGGTTCCGSDGCCTDCFIEDSFSPLCCEEESLCLPRSASNPEPPYCCRPGDICAPDGSPVGANCYMPARVCNGQYCDGECCGGTTCCQDGTYCSGGMCLTVPSGEEVPCLVDADCPAGLGCVDVVQELIPPDEEGGEPKIEVFPGRCCPGALVCESQLEPNQYGTPNAICCQAGQFCNGPFTCCELEGCSPRGGRTRL